MIPFRAIGFWRIPHHVATSNISQIQSELVEKVVLRIHRTSSWFCVLAICLCLPRLLANTGSIQGQVPLPETDEAAIPVEKYRGKISGQVATAPPLVAAVWLEAPHLSAPANPPVITLPQTNYQFVRSLIVIPTGTTVLFPNNDSDYHNIYSLSRPKRFDLGRYKKSENPAPTVLFDKAGFLDLHCEIHDHMRARIRVVDSPYFGTTDAKGQFTLTNISPGTYTLHAQLDRKTTWKQTIVVQKKATTRITFPKS
ncbi:carboxypeptidase regulatory-like domain-containing protein [Roseibacillus persicicus]|uniref:carboxypeptidase regulatory-like domain-containing protein n=1 Tax=Roseibacillus persicicus TaxID=454148 RepID=UPI00398AE1BF